jgi:hypothetical protein
MGDEDKGGIMDSMGKVGAEFGKSFTDNFNPEIILQTLKDVDKGAAEVLGTFGASREAIAAIRQNIANAIPDVTALGGEFNDIVQIQKQVSETLGKNLVLSTDAFKDMYAASKASGQEVGQITQSFKDVGISVYDSTKQMEGVVNIARASGVNASAVSSQVLSNMEALNKYNFEGGVQGLAKMAAQATSLRINMADSLAFAEKVFDPEGAINMAAAMQRLGVAQGDLLDPLRMMDLAQNDPGELQNQIAKMSQQFVQLKKDGTGFEIMPGAKRQMREIEKEMGLPLGQLSKMALASADLDDKMKKIKFPAATEEQKTMIANMAEMKGGQYVVNFTDKEGNVKEKAVSELSPDDIKQLAEASKPKSMEDLAKGQLDTLTRIQKILESQGRRLPSAIAASKGGKAVTEAPREIVEALETTTKGVTSKGLQQGLDKTTDIAFDVLNKFAQGTGTMADVSTAFSKISENTKTAFGESWSEAMKNGTTATHKLGESQNGIIQLLNTGIGTLKNSIAGTTSGNAVGSATQKVKVKDFIIESLPEDKIIMAGGTNLDGSKSGGGRGNSEPTVIKLDFSVDVKGGNITEHQFMEVLNKTGIKESLTKTVTMELNKNSPESSPQKIMNNNFKK